MRLLYDLTPLSFHFRPSLYRSVQRQSSKFLAVSKILRLSLKIWFRSFLLYHYPSFSVHTQYHTRCLYRIITRPKNLSLPDYDAGKPGPFILEDILSFIIIKKIMTLVLFPYFIIWNYVCFTFHETTKITKAVTRNKLFLYFLCKMPTSIYQWHHSITKVWPASCALIRSHPHSRILTLMSRRDARSLHSIMKRGQDE